MVAAEGRVRRNRHLGSDAVRCCEQQNLRLLADTHHSILLAPNKHRQASGIEAKAIYRNILRSTNLDNLDYSCYSLWDDVRKLLNLEIFEMSGIFTDAKNIDKRHNSWIKFKE